MTAVVHRLIPKPLEHTPGPWVVRHGTRGQPVGIDAPRDAGIPGAVGSVVRQNGIGFPSSQTAQANARLIAAAPDLLKACEDCMENRGDWAAVMGEAIDKARGIE